MQEKSKEFPEFIVNAISDVIKQYILELDVKDQNTILNFSAFSEKVVSEIEDGIIQSRILQTTTDIDYLYKVASERKEIILNNKDLYKDLEHLLGNTIPEYILIAIINGVNFLFEHYTITKDFETREFYGRFGENLSLDIQNYMLLNQINKNKK